MAAGLADHVWSCPNCGVPIGATLIGTGDFGPLIFSHSWSAPS